MNKIMIVTNCFLFSFGEFVDDFFFDNIKIIFTGESVLLLLQLGVYVFVISMFGLLTNKISLILYMVSLELLLLSCLLNYILFSFYLGLQHGFVVAIIILGCAASETALGLSIIVSCYNKNYSLNMIEFEQFGGI